MQNYIFSMDLEYGKYMNNLLSVTTHFDLCREILHSNNGTKSAKLSA